MAGEQRLCVFALRDVAAGEELTVHYNLRAHATAEAPCACGATNCEGKVPAVLAAGVGTAGVGEEAGEEEGGRVGGG